MDADEERNVSDARRYLVISHVLGCLMLSYNQIGSVR